DVDVRANLVVREGEVDDVVLKQRAVGNDDLQVVRRGDPRAAGADLGDGAGEAVDLDYVSDANRPLGEQDQPADKIVDDVLAAKADADGHRPAQEGKDRERHVQDPQGEQRERGHQG